MEIIIILGLILLNGLFSMSEIAVISSRKAKLSADAKKGVKSAQSALKLLESPESFLSTVQVGMTLLGILTGIYSGDVLSDRFAYFLIQQGISEEFAHMVAQVSIIFVVTVVSILFGELVPKRIGMASAEKITQLVARPMLMLSKIATPIVYVLSKTSNAIIRLIGAKGSDSIITEDEIRSMIQESTEDGEVQQVEQDIVERVFGLGDRDLETIMTHRSEIVFIDSTMTADQITALVQTHPHSKYPLADKDLDHISGIVYLRDIFGKIDATDFDIRNFASPAHFFSESMLVYKALEEMKLEKIEYAIICDEYGSTQGIVSLKDILEALVGTILNANEESEIVERTDGTYLIDGLCSFYNFLLYFKANDLYSRYHYNTVSGLIIDQLKHIPHIGERTVWQGFTFEVIDMDGTRIDKLLVSKQ